jgi:glutathione S-transferase
MGGQSRVAGVGIDLYVVHGSHPCAAVERALELKGLAYRRVELPPPLHAPIQKLRFGTRTVPGMRLPDGEKVVGSSAILRRLDDLAPEPPLFPPDGVARALVQRAEEWGEEVYQPIARRLLWAALRRAPDALPSYARGSRLPLPTAAIRAMAPAVTRVEATMNRAVEGAVRADLRALPRHLDRIDGWLRRGVLGASPPNAADLQIAASVRLLLTVGDAAPFLAGRPAEAHARAVLPPQAGSTPRGTFPADWLAGSPPRPRGA